MEKEDFWDIFEKRADDLINTTNFEVMETRKNETEQAGLQQIVKLQAKVGGVLDKLAEIKTCIQKYYDFLRYVRTPEVMEKLGVESARIENLGLVYLLSDYNISMKADSRPEAMAWLVQNGFGDILQESVNPSTLKAVLKKEVLAKGKEVPEHLFNVSPFTRSQIKK